jgi:hypothetical protein
MKFILLCKKIINLYHKKYHNHLKILKKFLMNITIIKILIKTFKILIFNKLKKYKYSHKKFKIKKVIS